MSEHKYNEAYSKGYKDGQKDQCLADAIDDALVMLGKLEVTNGDIIKAMFPKEGFTLRSGYYENIGRRVAIEYDWWNAPYREVGE